MGKHCRGTLPLQFDLLESIELLGSEVGNQPLAHFLIDRPCAATMAGNLAPFNTDALWRILAGHVPACGGEFGIDLEVGLDVGSCQEKDGRRANT